MKNRLGRTIHATCCMVALLFFGNAADCAAENGLDVEHGVDLSARAWWVRDGDIPTTVALNPPPPREIPWRVASFGDLKEITSQSGVAWFRCDFWMGRLPEKIPGRLLSARLTFGDLNGNDEVFLNGRRVGATRGRGISSHGIARQYVLSSTALQAQTTNTLLIRLEGSGGRKTLGLASPPAAISPLGGYELEEQEKGLLDAVRGAFYELRRFRVAMRHERKEMDIYKECAETFLLIERSIVERARPLREQGFLVRADEELQQASNRLTQFVSHASFDLGPVIERKLHEEEAKSNGLADLLKVPRENLRKRPASFGRFGKFYHDGLPVFREVSPTGFEFHGGVAVRFDLERVEHLQVIDIGWESKTTHVLAEVRSGGESPALTEYEVTETSLFPGLLLDVKSGAQFAFRIGGGEADARSPAFFLSLDSVDGKPTALSAAYPYSLSGPVALLSGEAGDCPWILVAERPLLMTAGATTDGLILRLNSSNPRDALGKIAIVSARGIEPTDTSKWKHGAISAEDRKQLTRLADLATRFPYRCREYYAVQRDRGRVLIADIFETIDFEKTRTREIACALPALLSFAAKSGLDVRLPEERFPLGVVGVGGPLEALAREDGILIYSLPIPPMEERGFVDRPGDDDLKALLNRHLSDLGEPTMLNAVDRTYKSRAQGYSAYAYLTPENRKRLDENSRRVIPSTFDPTIWYNQREPFSGLNYYYTYYIEGPYFDSYDQAWGNGLSLYGLYKYAQYTGDWESVKENWYTVERMASWFKVSDDWDWMRCANAEHGHGTGAGDCTSAAYAGTLAFAKMAAQAGEAEDADLGCYMAARTAMFATLRFQYRNFARGHGLIGPDTYPIGFHEGPGFLEGELDGYLWNVTSCISGNGVQVENFNLYMKWCEGWLSEYETLVAKYHPNWCDANYDYGRETLYRGNSGYITLPHIYARARLGESKEKLREYVEKAKPNEYLWWLAPTVLGEILARDTGVYLLEWAPARYVYGRLDGNVLKLDFELKPPSGEAELIVQLPRPPKSATRNEKVIENLDWDKSAGRLSVALEPVGNISIVVELEDTAKE